MRPFHYLAPRRLDEALSLLTPRAVPLAGGTDLFLRMERRQTQPDTVVDLKRIPDMDEVEAVDGGGPHRRPGPHGDLGRLPADFGPL